MTKPVDTSILAGKTGRSWEQWLAFLQNIDAEHMSHAAIAERIVATGDASGWWAQTITVAYEQHIGRRQPGQRSDGSHEVSVSKTVPGSPDDALALWKVRAGALETDGSVEFAEPASTSGSQKWRYWRRPLADGSRLNVTIGEKPGGKATIALTHEKLAGPDEVEDWRGFWKARLADLASR
ncbi:hypothetical protein [Pelagibacterium limicola]|uniref:hypothetical protein n=1 Tax=Pelagibacterium limicola TaxID=2791022 RepID=UPI0018AFC736|nr:hypothetical protein [Pelagibacterium limicola]